MKKKIWMVALSLLVLAGVALGAGIVTKAKENVHVATNAVIKERIGIQNAKTIALTKVPGKVRKVELEHKKGISYYEVNINKNNQEFDVYIEAYTGKVLKVKLDDKGHEKKTNVITTTTPSSSITAITLDQAINIAEKHVNGKLIKVEKETEHGLLVYKVELKTTNGKTDVYVQPSTGKIVKVKTKHSKDDDKNDDDDDK
jgi:uncharacterized membrane protein YkoI